MFCKTADGTVRAQPPRAIIAQAD